MIRTTHPNVTAVDKAFYLWMLCLIDWMHENNEPISNNNMDRLFGESIRKRFNFYYEIALEFRDVAPEAPKLLPKGQRIVNNWKQWQDKIFDV